MTAFNAVRFKVKAGAEQQFLDAHNKIADASGLGFVAEYHQDWRAYLLHHRRMDRHGCACQRTRQHDRDARLVRGHVEDLGGGLDITDPMSGQVVKVLK